MTHVYERAVIKILDWLHLAERELVGNVIATFNGETGKVLAVRLDDHHGLCFTIDDPDMNEDGLLSQRWYPVSTIKQVAL
jgi:hypothetical protein